MNQTAASSNCQRDIAVHAVVRGFAKSFSDRDRQWCVVEYKKVFRHVFAGILDLPPASPATWRACGAAAARHKPPTVIRP